MFDPVPRSHLALQSPESRRISQALRAKRLRGGSTTPLLMDELNSDQEERLVTRGRNIFRAEIVQNDNISRNYERFTRRNVPADIRRTVINMYGIHYFNFVDIFVRKHGNDYDDDLDRIINQFQQEFADYRVSQRVQDWYILGR